jgi:hypothetical protein
MVRFRAAAWLHEAAGPFAVNVIGIVRMTATLAEKNAKSAL